MNTMFILCQYYMCNIYIVSITSVKHQKLFKEQLSSCCSIWIQSWIAWTDCRRTNGEVCMAMAWETYLTIVATELLLIKLNVTCPARFTDLQTGTWKCRPWRSVRPACWDRFPGQVCLCDVDTASGCCFPPELCCLAIECFRADWWLVWMQSRFPVNV